MNHRTLLSLLSLAIVPAMHAQLPPACAPFGANCLYTSATLPTGGFASSFSYSDITGNLRTVDVYVRYPIGPVGAMPVVLWSPNAESTGPAQQRMAVWSETTAAAGYISVTLAHSRRTLTIKQQAALCTALHFSVETCHEVDPVNWDWPHDLHEAIDWLQRIHQSGPSEVRGRIDLNRIAIAGHQDGSSGAISLAGALRLLTTQDRKSANDLSDPRPVAFIGLSPQGPNLEGFFDTDKLSALQSWKSIARPVLSLTGSGDNNCNLPGNCMSGDTPSRRRVPFDLMPAGGKYEGFIRSVGVSHDFFGSLDVAGCVLAGVAPGLCANAKNWLQSTVLAFLDARVRGIPLAQLWLQNGLIAPASGAIVMWQSK